MSISRLAPWALISLFLVNLSCQPFKTQGSKEQAGTSFETAPFNFDVGFKVDPECMKKSEFNACLILKNPLHHAAKSDGEDPESTDISSLQTVGVNLKTKDGLFLQNDTVSVESANGQRAKADGDVWKFPADLNDANDFFGQVMAYFWLNYSVGIAERDSGIFWAVNKNIRVLINDEFSGWSASGNTIHLQKAEGGKLPTHDAGLMVYYLGLANLHYATNGKIAELTNDQDHRSCGSVKKDRHCCKDADGCAMALSSGAADYFVAATFPQAPTLGEAWSNRLSGLQACGLSRDLNENKDLSVQQAYAACAGQSGEGYIYPMGTVYASIWWEVRKKSKASEIDRLYQYHLKRLNAADDFLTAYEKILATDRELYSGKYKPLFQEEFARRGLSTP